MAFSDTASIFTSDSYSAASYRDSDPLSAAVGRTKMVDPAILSQPSDTPTATTVDSPAGSKTSGITSSEAAAGAKGIVKSALVTTKLLMDLNSAKSAYRSTTAEIRNNLMLSRLNEDDTISRGQQAILERKTEGQLMSKQALSHLAAQGLDVSSPGAQNVIKSYEAMGIYNAMREEANMYREAFKYDIEQSQLDFAADMAEVNYEVQKFNATMDFVGGQADADASMVPMFS